MNCKQRVNSGRRLAEEMCVPDVCHGEPALPVSQMESAKTQRKTSMGLEEQKHPTWLEQKTCKEVLAHKSQMVEDLRVKELGIFRLFIIRNKLGACLFCFVFP